MDGLVGEGLLREAARHAEDPAWLDFWRAVSALGGAGFYAVLLPVLFATIPWPRALRFGAAFLLSAWSSEALKAWVGRPRPDLSLLGLSEALEHAGRFESSGFPSGHVTMGVMVWGWVALQTRSTLARVGCVLLVLLLAASRIALLRHDLLDLAGGLLLGLGLLALFRIFERNWLGRLALLPRVEQAGLWLLGAIAAQVVVGQDGTAAICGVAAGLGVGSVLAASGRTRPAGSGGHTLLRMLLGIGGVALVRMAADPLASTGAVAALYGLGGFWIAAGIPRLTGGALVRS